MKLCSRKKREHELLERNDNGIFNDIIGEFSENYKKMKKFQPKRKDQSEKSRMNRILTEKEFYRYIFRDHKPSAYEKFGPDDTRFFDDAFYSHICRTRYFFIYRQIASQVCNDPEKKFKVLDLGFFPGCLIRILKGLLGENISCSGSGLKLNKDFLSHIAPFMEKVEYAEFDPFYKKKEEPIKIEFDNDSFDIIVGSELLEHLISPVELICEASRILRVGGTFIVTTPNVSHIGAVIKLILGRSNYERLERSPMSLQNDEWRGHNRFYDKRELEVLFKKRQLKLIHHRYYTELGWDRVKRTLLQKIIFRIRKVFFCIPIYREGHFCVFKKI